MCAPQKNNNKSNFKCPLLYAHSISIFQLSTGQMLQSIYKQMCWWGSGHAACLTFNAWRAKCALLFDFHVLNRHLPKNVKCQIVLRLLKALHCFRKIESSCHSFKSLFFNLLCSKPLDVEESATAMKAICSIVVILWIIFPVLLYTLSRCSVQIYFCISA